MTAAQLAAPREIRGLTIHQPWAWFIARGFKDIENRSWRPPASIVGGYLAIHAGKAFDPHGVLLDWAVSVADGLVPRVPIPADEMFAQRGCIIAVARLVGAVTESESGWFCGPIGWQLADVVAIEPVLCRGAQGLWTLPPDVLATVRARYAAATTERRLAP